MPLFCNLHLTLPTMSLGLGLVSSGLAKITDRPRLVPWRRRNKLSPRCSSISTNQRSGPRQVWSSRRPRQTQAGWVYSRQAKLVWPPSSVWSCYAGREIHAAEILVVLSNLHWTGLWCHRQLSWSLLRLYIEPAYLHQHQHFIIKRWQLQSQGCHTVAQIHTILLLNGINESHGVNSLAIFWHSIHSSQRKYKKHSWWLFT